MKLTAPRIDVQGFTLVEVLIAAAILAILVAIASPSISGLVVTYKVDSASYQIVTELMLARTRAIGQNGRSIATFYSPSGGPYRYEIHDDKNGNGTRDAGEAVKLVMLPTGIQFGASSLGFSYLISTATGGYLTTMYDDGTHGDSASGDGIYTNRDTSPPTSSPERGR